MTQYQQQITGQTNVAYYTTETADFDFGPMVAAASESVFGRSTSIKDFVSNVAQYVYNNVAYDWLAVNLCASELLANDLFGGCRAILDTCRNRDASQILTDKIGVCSTQSEAVVALLRYKGVPSRVVIGCFCNNTTQTNCGALFGIGAPAPIFQKTVTLDSEGRGINMGGLHAWVEVYLPDYGGWTIVEATNGHAYTRLCYPYVKSAEPANGDRNTICSNPDMAFVNYCKTC
jgi:transglutaminase-like putative cysteine protease